MATETGGTSDGTAQGGLTDERRQELEKIADQDLTTITIVSFFLPFVGYLLLGKTLLAIANIVTLNFFFLGFIIAPLHARKMVSEARAELGRTGDD